MTNSHNNDGVVMKIKHELRERPDKSDRKNAFRGLKGMFEKSPRVLIAAFAVSAAVACSDEAGDPGPATGPDAGGATEIDSRDTGGAGGTDATGGTDTGGAPASLCVSYTEGHPNRITLSLGQRVEVEDSEECQTTLVFGGLINDDGTKARVGGYDEPSAYPVSYMEIALGVRTAVAFRGVSMVAIEACEATSNPCEINVQTGTISGDADCTVSMAAQLPWVPASQ
jgi:hypothetical protein